MLRRLFGTAVKAGLASVDLLDTLVKRGEAFVYGEADKPVSHEPKVEKGVEPSPNPEDEDVVEETSRASSEQPAEPLEDMPSKASEPSRPSVHENRQKSPPICLKTIVTDRTVCLNAIGKPAVLIFHGQRNANEAAMVNASIQERFFPHQKVFVANIVPLRIVPSFLRRVAEQEMEKAYHKGVRQYLDSREGGKPEEMIYIFPDWRNETVEAFGLGDPWQEIGIVVLDETGGIVGTYQGGQPVQKALEWLNRCDLSL